MCVSVCVCLFLSNLGDSFVSLLVEPIAGKNVTPSDEQLSSSGNFFAFDDVSRKHQNANFCISVYSISVSSISWALSIVITSCSSAICGVLSINS